jgi:hypothetical protein
MKALITLCVAFAATSCTGLIDERHTYIDPALKPYYTSFLAEASQRGFDFNGIDITMVIAPLETCGLTVHEKQTVYIDTTSTCWAIDKRELVYHELGHYLLKRQHDNGLIKGRIKSIMIGEGYIINLPARQKYYFDELFNPNTNTPIN